MKDLHTHVLYGIDDGSGSLDESKALLEGLYNEGITDIVATPHYILGGTFKADNTKKRKLLNEIQKYSKINIYLGNEVFMDYGIIDHIKSNGISTINNTNYLLVELPRHQKLLNGDILLKDLQDKGVKVILAHPERYEYMSMKDYKKLIDMGILFQGNITALNGKYGDKAKKVFIKLIKKKYYFVLGTDTHHKAEIHLNDALMLLKKITKEDYYNDITNNNFDKIINND